MIFLMHLKFTVVVTALRRALIREGLIGGMGQARMQVRGSGGLAKQLTHKSVERRTGNWNTSVTVGLDPSQVRASDVRTVNSNKITVPSGWYI